MPLFQLEWPLFELTWTLSHLARVLCRPLFQMAQPLFELARTLFQLAQPLFQMAMTQFQLAGTLIEMELPIFKVIREYYMNCVLWANIPCCNIMLFINLTIQHQRLTKEMHLTIAMPGEASQPG